MISQIDKLEGRPVYTLTLTDDCESPILVRRMMFTASLSVATQLANTQMFAEQRYYMERKAQQEFDRIRAWQHGRWPRLRWHWYRFQQWRFERVFR